MLRRLATVTSLLAIAFGVAAAPHMHLHRAPEPISGAHHSHGTTLHAHVTAHAAIHDPQGTAVEGPEGNHAAPGEPAWAVDTFVFQSTATAQPSAPELIATAEPQPDTASLWLKTRRMHPPAHGPPAIVPSGLRAPPLSPPALS